nr:hypothetical protein [Allomuricauda sp.]
MEFFVELLYVLVRNRFVFLVVVVFLIVITRISAQFKKDPGLKRKILSRASSFLLLISLLILIFGSEYTNGLIYDYGQIGEGVIVDKGKTGDVYNEEPIIRFQTLIKTTAGATVQTTFDSNHFNLYPSLEDSYAYPDVGSSFTVKHLKRNPKVFVIVTNDDSPYASDLRCSELFRKLRAAKSKLDFNPDDEEFRRQYESYAEAYFSSHCNKQESAGLK